MRKHGIVCATVCALVFGAAARAQVPPKSITVIHVIKVKPGADFEAALKRHMQWHQAQKDTWALYTWQIISGERTGQYVVGTGGHDWKEFDDRAKFQEADMANVREVVFPAAESASTAYFLRRPDLSVPAAPEGSPDPYVEVITFFTKPSAWEPDMDNAIKKVNEAAKQSQYPLHGEWYNLVNGGEAAMVLAIGRKNWADFQPPEKTFGAMLGEVYGPQLTRALFKQFYGSVRAVRSEIFQYRPDLSYLPGASQ